MDLKLFDYQFPKELTAQQPAEKRDESRLMVLNRASQTWEHRVFKNLSEFLRPGDLLVMNNADADHVVMEENGVQKLVPALPPYIKRKKISDFTDEDFERYRTVYAQVKGSKAAPTAGFHFTDELLVDLKDKGVETAFVTLHVSFDTFKPIRSENVLEHPMHGESFEISEETIQKIKKAKLEGRRVIAVGTTSTRVLESWGGLRGDEGGAASSRGGQERRVPTVGDTHLFITPGYSFKVIDGMITNFHRPRSTVLVLVCSFAGRDFVMRAYEEAIREKYRLFSYGDAMLIL